MYLPSCLSSTTVLASRYVGCRLFPSSSLSLSNMNFVSVCLYFITLTSTASLYQMRALYRFRVATNPENALNRSVMNERYGIQLPLIASRVPHKVLLVLVFVHKLFSRSNASGLSWPPRLLLRFQSSPKLSSLIPFDFLLLFLDGLEKP